MTITYADPTVVVEVLADTAQSGGRRRHPLRFVWVRLDRAPRGETLVPGRSMLGMLAEQELVRGQ